MWSELWMGIRGCRAHTRMYRGRTERCDVDRLLMMNCIEVMVYCVRSLSRRAEGFAPPHEVVLAKYE
jgi:hypothetical protein